MSTKRVTIPSVPSLEGVLSPGSPDKGVVIAHPHPLYGGSMDSNVVEAIHEGFHKSGFTTVRFNFRGVGGSGGTYDEGEGEVDDLLSSVRFLRDRLSPEGRIVLAGYSFGAWISAKAAAKAGPVDGLFLVAYPFAFYDTEPLRAYSGPVSFVAGTLDEIGPAHDLTEFYKTIPITRKHLKVLPTDHFFWGKEREIVDFIKERFLLPEK